MKWLTMLRGRKAAKGDGLSGRGPDLEHLKRCRSEWLGAAGKCLGVIAAVGLISYESYRASVTSWLQIADSLATVVSAYTEQTLGSSALVLKSLVESIKDADVRSEADLRHLSEGEPLFEELRLLIKNQPQIGVASIVALDGSLLTFSRSFPHPYQNLSDRDYFKAALNLPAGEVFLSRPVQNKTNGVWTFYLATALRSRAGTVIGVALVGLQVDFFVDFYSRTSPGKGTAISLFREGGIVLARTQVGSVQPGSERNLKYVQAMLQSGPAPPAMLVAEPGPADLTIATNRILAPRKLSQFPAIVVVAIGDDRYLANWWRTNYYVGAAALVVLVGIVLALRRHLRVLGEQEGAREREQNRRLLAAIAESPSALNAVVNQHGQVIHANRRFWDALKNAELQGPGILKSASLRGTDALIDFASSASEPEVQSKDFEIQMVDQGRKAFLHLSATRQHLGELGPCVVLVGHDVTERLQTQAALAQSAKLVTLGEMTTGVAHELNQPLFVISMAAQNALEDIRRDSAGAAALGDDASRRLRALVSRLADKFDQVSAQVKRATAIIQNMRVFGRTADIEATLFDVRDACRSATDLVREQIRVSGITLKVQLGDKILLASGTQSTLEQVILNLVINAGDALRDSPVKPKLIVVSSRFDPESNKLIVEVVDNGPGIPENVRERIFDPFFTTKPVGQGVGLGLSISYGIIRDMGGVLSLVSGDVGAAFRIELPSAG